MMNMIKLILKMKTQALQVKRAIKKGLKMKNKQRKSLNKTPN